MERKDRIGKLEQATGTHGEQKTRKIRIRGAHGILWEYTIGVVNERAQVISERIVSPEEEARGRGTPEAEARGRARADLQHSVWWIGEHFADKYPTLSDRLDYARKQAKPEKGEGRLYDEVVAELLAENP